jgi:putative sigma-54 modulation protein
MNVNTQSVNFNADGKLLDFTQKRLDKLDLFYDRVVNAEVYLRLENTSQKENKTAEIKLHVPKDTLLVKKQCKSFEEAVDTACSSLERLLVKKKKKPNLHNSLKFF